MDPVTDRAIDFGRFEALTFDCYGTLVDWETGILTGLRGSLAGLSPDVRRMSANLRLYERGQACRTPWQPNETVFSPGPPISPELASVLASGRS